MAGLNRLPENLQSCGLRHGVAHRFDELEDLRSWLLGKERDGWLCCTAEVRLWSSDEGGLPEGIPLSGEFLSTASKKQGRETAHLRYSNGIWTVWQFVEVAEGELGGENVEYVSTERGLMVRYRRYWRQEKEDNVWVWRPFAARFLGWRSTR